MPIYTHDMMHCSQRTCTKKDSCYRYWLGQEYNNHGWDFASFYYPQKPVKNGCDNYLNIKDY